MNQMEQILVIMTVLTPVIMGLTAMVKNVLYGSDPAPDSPGLKFQPLIPFVLGIVIGLAYSPLSTEPWYTLLWAGALAGLSSGGFYSVQNIRNKE